MLVKRKITSFGDIGSFQVMPVCQGPLLENPSVPAFQEGFRLRIQKAGFGSVCIEVPEAVEVRIFLKATYFLYLQLQCHDRKGFHRLRSFSLF